MRLWMAKLKSMLLLGVLAGIAVPSAYAQFQPVPFPKEIPEANFTFPTPESDIDGWVKSGDVDSIANHAWCLWLGLNSPSGQKFGNRELAIFETWNVDSELPQSSSLLDSPKIRSVFNPQKLRQSRFHQGNRNELDEVPANSPLGFVKFDPSAVDFILMNRLNSRKTLNGLIMQGKIANVPDFPSSAVSLKIPVVQATSDPSEPGFYKFMVWPGPPETPQAFDESKWNTWVWVDLDPSHPNTGDGSVAGPSVARSPNNTYSINQFINFTNSSGGTTIVAGMHVTSREIKEWTWQTFWWTPDPAAPPAPSSAAISKARPKALLDMGAPSHYAVSLAYSMTGPKGEDVYGYNPYLEARFSDLAGKNQFGIQSNCMSCHANATWPGIKDAYVGDEEVDILGPQFQGQVRLDFLYSLGEIAK